MPGYTIRYKNSQHEVNLGMGVSVRKVYNEVADSIRLPDISEVRIEGIYSGYTYKPWHTAPITSKDILLVYDQ